MKNEKKSTNNVFYFYFFLYRKFYILLKHIWKNLISINTFVLAFLRHKLMNHKLF